MQTQEQSTHEKPAKKNMNKNDRFNWWQATIILVLTLGICLVAGYYISDKYLWKNSDEVKIEERLKYYKMQVEEKPNDVKTRVQLGYSYFLMKDYDEAIKQYKVATSLDKNYYDAYLNLAIVYDNENQINDALEMSTKAVKLAPKDYKGHLLKGRAYRKLKMYKEASTELSEASRLMKGNVDIIYEIGLVAEAQGKIKEAEQIYKEALSYDPLYKAAQKSLERISSKESNDK
jgi:tetratricopeptide (TPR) repeat protein